MELTDGKVKTSFAVKVVSVSNDKKSLTVQSNLSTSYKGRHQVQKPCFKKYQGPEEEVDTEQVVSALPKPAMLLGERVHFKTQVKELKGLNNIFIL